MKTKVFAYFSIFSMFFAISVSFLRAQTSSVYDIAAGTLIPVRMDNEINSKAASVNDTFTTTLAEPLTIRNVVVLPAGTIIEGKITRVEHAALGGRNGSLTVSFETLRLADGTKRAIEGVLVKELSAKNNTSPKLKALTIVGAAAAGGIGGAISKAQNGALIGAGIGAGAGTIIALLQKGREVSIKADERFEIRLTKNVSLPAQDY